MSAREPMINPYEVNELTKYCLRILTYTDELRGDTALKQAYEKAKELENVAGRGQEIHAGRTAHSVSTGQNGQLMW